MKKNDLTIWLLVIVAAAILLLDSYGSLGTYWTRIGDWITTVGQSTTSTKTSTAKSSSKTAASTKPTHGYPVETTSPVNTQGLPPWIAKILRGLPSWATNTYTVHP